MNQTKSDVQRVAPRATDSDVLAAVTKMLNTRSNLMRVGLIEGEFSEQLRGGKHLDEGTAERAYWHAGYVTAMRDVLRMIERHPREWPEEVEGVGRADS